MAWRRDAAGSILPLAAKGLIVLAALVSGGEDLSRGYKAKIRLQSACDAGILAGRRSVSHSGFDADALAEANACFARKFGTENHEAKNLRFVPHSSDNGNTVTATATACVCGPTIIMRIFGYETMKVSASCSASMGFGDSDVTMVLDTTGSMGWTL